MIRRSFTASFVSTIALAACGSPPRHTENPPGPHENPPALSSWTVSEAGNGQCYAVEDNLGSEAPQQLVECPDDVRGDVTAKLRETSPGVCVATLASCEEACDEIAVDCPSDEPGELEDPSGVSVDARHTSY